MGLLCHMGHLGKYCQFVSVLHFRFSVRICVCVPVPVPVLVPVCVPVPFCVRVNFFMALWTFCLKMHLSCWFIRPVGGGVELKEPLIWAVMGKTNRNLSASSLKRSIGWSNFQPNPSRWTVPLLKVLCLIRFEIDNYVTCSAVYRREFSKEYLYNLRGNETC